jgi:hypothetical protein
MRSIEPGCFRSYASDRILGVFGKLLKRRGAWAWFYGVWICDAKVFEH